MNLASRKFILTVGGLVAIITLLVLKFLTGGEFITGLSIIISAYFGANVMAKRYNTYNTPVYNAPVSGVLNEEGEA